MYYVTSEAEISALYVFLGRRNTGNKGQEMKEPTHALQVQTGSIASNPTKDGQREFQSSTKKKLKKADELAKLHWRVASNEKYVCLVPVVRELVV